MFLYKFVIGVIHDYRLCLRLLTLVNVICHNPKSKRDWHMIKKYIRTTMTMLTLKLVKLEHLLNKEDLND
jgi:hypothetical protein